MEDTTYQRRKAAGLCTRCGAPKGITLLCEKCRNRLRTRLPYIQECTARVRRERRAAGQCWHCKQPAEPMRTLCKYHLKYCRERYRGTLWH